jgi:alcohol dehydrogenase
VYYKDVEAALRMPGNSFNYHPRTRLIFGEGVLDSLGELVKEFGGKHVLLVTDGGVAKAGHAARAEQTLAKAGIGVLLFDKVRENPSTRQVAECVAFARTQNIDFIVGLGGGSSMDTAKGTNFILTNGGKMSDYWGVNKARKPMLPLIAIPTTAGTGSECQSYALIADEDTHQKMACGDDKAYACAALLDPVLTLSQPPRVTANTGIDTVTHALESHVTSKRTPISQLFSRESWKLAESSLDTVISEPQNLHARGQMLLASAYGGTAIAQSMLGAVHSAANPLTAHFNIVHGQAVGIMLPHVIRFNSRDPQAMAHYVDLAATAGLARRGDDPEQSLSTILARIVALLAAAEIPDSLKDCGVPRDKLSSLAEEASRQWTATFNPAKISAADFKALYEAAWESRRQTLKIPAGAASERKDDA